MKNLIKQDSIQEEWYNKLIEDLKRLEFTGIVLTKWNIGKRIVKDELKFDKPQYGSKTIENLARDLNTSKREIWRCIQFYKKCHDVTQLKSKSWHFIANHLLPEPEKEKKQTPAPPKGKYNVIYADPPWQYDVDLSRGRTRSPENNYPVMDLQAIKDFGEKVKEISCDDCVLFMWIPAPKLNWMNEVLDAWGFEYKTNLIWDKVKPNMEHYSSVRHEILIIAGKGNCSPLCDGKTIQSIDSVQSIEKSSRHSEKPREFVEIIEKLYPNQRYIELFARNKEVRKGWTYWGNESKNK